VPWTEREWGDRHVLFRELPDAVRNRLPAELSGFAFKNLGSLAQLYYRDPKVHYELWFHWRTGRLEVGLHFERDESVNQLLFDAFDRRIVEIKATLGETIDLERWDKGWARIYETWPCDRVDRDFRAHTIDRLSQIIAVLQPIYDSAADSSATLRDSLPRTRTRVVGRSRSRESRNVGDPGRGPTRSDR
jgi:hypothetical protein